MIDILFSSFDSLNIYLILFIGFIFYNNHKKSRKDQLNKTEKELIISSKRRSEGSPQQYPNGWLPVYDSNDLKKGEVKPIFALGRDLVIYRGTSGKVYLFDAYCPHLGANLGVGGTVVGDDIKCHFHGWSFNNQGDCIAIPGLEDKSIPKATIRKWRCDEVNDFIYVWHHLEGKEPDWFIHKEDKLDKLVYRGNFIMKPYCHVQDILENECDHPHFDTIHGTENLIPKFIQHFIKFKMYQKNWKVCDPPNTHSTQMEIVLNFKIGGLTLPKIYVYSRTIGPAYLFSDLPGNFGIIPHLFFTLNVITLDNFKQAFVLKWYSEPSIRGFIFGKLSPLFTSFTISPDLKVWNHKRYVPTPILTKLDEPLVRFRRWYKQFYSEKSKNN